jgi:hypothetical protein
MDSDGGNLQRLTRNPGIDWRPDWFDPTVRYGISPVERCMVLWSWLKNPIAFPMYLNRGAKTKIR